MRRCALFVALLLGASIVPLNSQNNSTCRYVVREVSFEEPAGLTADQVATLRKLVIGRCYDPATGMFISDGIYDQLRLWGYGKATVYDPNNFHVLDPNTHPSPIAVVVDFQLTDSGSAAKADCEDTQRMHR
jgi:hypothetical protein